MKKERVVAVSGGFDPVHVGHVRLMQESRALGTRLVVILNNDNWLKNKKNYVFMNEDERKEVLLALECVDDVIITEHSENDPDTTVCRELARLHPDVFANGGDRKEGNVPEYDVCKDLGIELAFNVGGEKIQSSSWLVDKGKEK